MTQQHEYHKDTTKMYDKKKHNQKPRPKDWSLTSFQTDRMVVNKKSNGKV